jgi:hypothetical protein
LVIFQEHPGSINSAVFTWKNNGKLEVAQHIADYEIGHSARSAAKPSGSSNAQRLSNSMTG